MPVDKLTIEQFAQKVKAKYPQYKDINDSVLVDKMVNKYPEYKDQINYSSKNESTQSQPTPKFQSASDWLSMPQGYQPMVPENAVQVVDDHESKVAKSKQRVSDHLYDIDNSVHNLIYNQKKDLKGRIVSEQLGLNPKETGPINPQAQLLESQERQDIPVTPQEIGEFKTGMNENQVMARQALNQKAKDLSKNDPTTAKQLKADIYRLDRQANPEKESKVDENIEKIKEGEYDYDVVKGQLIKPQGFFGSLVTGYKEKVQAFDDAGVYESGDKKAILDLIKERLKNDPDKAIPVPEESWLGMAEMGRMAGGQPLKPLIGGGAVGLLLGPEAAAVTASLASVPEMYRLTLGSALPYNYDALKKQEPNLSDDETLQKALDLTHKQAAVDAVSGAAMGALGARAGFGPTGLKTGLLQKSLGSALKQIGQEGAKKTIEGLGVGSIGAASQYVKNIMSQKAGIPTDTSEGLAQQLWGGVQMTMAMTLIAKAPELLKPKTYGQLLQAVRNVPKEEVQAHLSELEQSGQITPEQSQSAQKAIEEHQALDNSIKPDVPESDRLKVQELIKKRNDLEVSLESTDKAYHADVKEEIKTLNEQIVNISKGGERGELQQLIDAEHKSGNIEGFVTDALRDASESDLKKYFKEISEQVYGGNEDMAIQTFGENVVNKAKELYPQELDINSLFDGTKSTKEIVSNLKNQVNDEFLNDQIDKLIPYLESNPEIKFSKMFSIGRGEAHLTGDWTVLLSHIKDKKQLIETIVHELYHNISVNKLLNDSGFDNNIRNIRESVIKKLELNDYLNGAKNTDFGFTKDKKYYGLLDNKEFIAELFSNKEFNNLLDGIKVEDKNTMLDKVVNIIRKALGIKDLSYTEKIKKTILGGIDHKIEFEKDPTIKQVIENLKEAHRPEDFAFGEILSDAPIQKGHVDLFSELENVGKIKGEKARSNSIDRISAKYGLLKERAEYINNNFVELERQLLSSKVIEKICP